MPPLEIRALARIIDELDYYQILHLEPSASQSEVKRAYFATSRTFHPDANRSLEKSAREQCMHIAKRVTEAYCVLRDPRRRRSYDDQLSAGGDAGDPKEPRRIRMQLTDAREAHVKRESQERQGRTPQGRQFYQKAVAARDRGDRASTISNLQMALTFEPDNAFFKQALQDAKARA